jgi:hypothetical protein
VKLKLEQNQVWKLGPENYVLIVEWERLAIGYKAMKDLAARDGVHHKVTKKEFCRLIKGATLLTKEQVRNFDAPPPMAP